MYFQHINRTDAERVFIVVKNTYSTAAITTGQVVAWDYTTDKDGVGVTRPTTALLKAEAGVVSDDSIAVGEYGSVQVYGHATNVVVDGSSGSAGGTPLVMQNASFELIIGAGAAGASHGFISGAVNSTGAAAAQAVFIRCL